MKSSILPIHLDILDKNRQKLLVKLLPFAGRFVLGGGTGLALQIAHRKSFDFDFFSQSPISKQLLERLSKELSIANIAVDTSDELTFFTQDDIKVTLLHYPFESYFKPLELKSGLILYTVQDIAFQKAYAIGRRGEYRDYFDLYSILKNDFIQLKDLIAAARKVYGSLFDEKIFLQQLVYFGDLKNFDLIPVDQTVLPKPNQVKNYLEALVKNYIP